MAIYEVIPGKLSIPQVTDLPQYRFIELFYIFYNILVNIVYVRRLSLSPDMGTCRAISIILERRDVVYHQIFKILYREIDEVT